jgi:hypothetical protein
MRSLHVSKEVVMNRIHRIRRSVGALATLAGALLAVGAAAPAALATMPPPDPGAPGVVSPPVVIHTGGMPGWQIALIAIGGALFAAAVAVLADRAWVARRRMATATTT